MYQSAILCLYLEPLYKQHPHKPRPRGQRASSEARRNGRSRLLPRKGAPGAVQEVVPLKHAADLLGLDVAVGDVETHCVVVVVVGGGVKKSVVLRGVSG